MGSNKRAGSASKVRIDKFEDLFGGSAEQESSAEQIINAPLTDLHTFKDHPFRVEDDEKMEETTESIRQYGVLVPGMVDSKKLGFSQGVDISFLTEEAQQWVQAVIEEKSCNISMVQSAKIKEYGKTGELTLAMVRLILTEEKPKERKVTLKADKISEYFAEDYSSEEIEGIIIQLLDYRQSKSGSGDCGADRQAAGYRSAWLTGKVAGGFPCRRNRPAFL